MLDTEIQSLVSNLEVLQRASAATTNGSQRPVIPSVPPEVIEYVERGRNPQIYVREHVELAMRSNQYLKGKAEGFARFADVLGEELVGSGIVGRQGVAKINGTAVNGDG